MPKDRKRTLPHGSKSIAIRTKNKINGRKSNKGTGGIARIELIRLFAICRNRDKNKINRELDKRNV